MSCFGFVGAAHAAVTQPPPDSTPLPLPVTTPEVQVVTSRGFPASAITLEGLFAYRSDPLDPSADATADPGTFTPLCEGTSLTAEFVLSGGGCRLPLGWYNANGEPPGADAIHPLVPATAAMDMACSLPDFCPLAGMSTYPYTWLPVTYNQDICNDPLYEGGAIGFALVGDPADVCTQTKFSERTVNVMCTSCTPITPWITTLIYRSAVRSDGYYLAFEDLPMDPNDWNAIPSGTLYAPDGDFNDFVFHVTGVCHGTDECSAGGSGTGGSGGTSTGGSDTGGSSTGGADTGGASGRGGSSGSATGGGDTGGTAGLGEGGDGVGGSSGMCVPGREEPCTCTNGDEGSQRCRNSGLGFGPCACSGGGDEGDDQAAEGCGCRQARGGDAGLWAFAVMALVALRRRSFRRGASVFR